MEEFFSILVFVAYFVFTYIMAERKKKREREREQQARRQQPEPSPTGSKEPTYRPQRKRDAEARSEPGRAFEDVFREIFDEPVQETEIPPKPVSTEVYTPEITKKVPKPKGQSLNPLTNKERADVDLIKAKESRAFDLDRGKNKKKRHRINLRQALIYQAILERPYK